MSVNKNFSSTPKPGSHRSNNVTLFSISRPVGVIYHRSQCHLVPTTIIWLAHESQYALNWFKLNCVSSQTESMETFRSKLAHWTTDLLNNYKLKLSVSPMKRTIFGWKNMKTRLIVDCDQCLKKLTNSEFASIFIKEHQARTTHSRVAHASPQPLKQKTSDISQLTLNML